MSGLIPAIPLIVIRPFLPESPSWAKKRELGTLRRPSIAELFSPQLRFTTIITTLMFMCSFGVAFGAIQQMPQIVPGLHDVQAEIKAKVDKFDEPAKEAMRKKLAAEGKSEAAIKAAIAAAPRQMTTQTELLRAAEATKVQEVGGMFGRVALAILIGFVASRGRVLRMFVGPSLIIMPIVFVFAATQDLTMLKYGIFVAGFLTVAQFSFWGNYLPHAYPVHLRGTGESFAANIGGRLLGTSFAAVTQWIAEVLPIDTSDSNKVAYTAAGVAFTLCLINFVASFWLPEPHAGDINE
jgi:hypothetical protein